MMFGGFGSKYLLGSVAVTKPSTLISPRHLRANRWQSDPMCGHTFPSRPLAETREVRVDPLAGVVHCRTEVARFVFIFRLAWPPVKLADTVSSNTVPQPPGQLAVAPPLEVVP